MSVPIERCAACTQGWVGKVELVREQRDELVGLLEAAPRDMGGSWSTWWGEVDGVLQRLQSEI